MQVTVAAYYGNKPTQLLEFIQTCQAKISYHLSSFFKPYEIPQVHATIIGLEGVISEQLIFNKNMLEQRGEKLTMKLEQFLNFIKSTNILPLDIQIGGFPKDKVYPFSSQGQHPYLRSFSIQNEIAVVMGWPVRDSEYPKSLYQLRHTLERFNILHKYHNNEGSVDNDFFFVIGHINRRQVDSKTVQELEIEMREYMSAIKPFKILVGHEQISVICYSDPRLPINTSVVLPLTDADTTSDKLISCYKA